MNRRSFFQTTLTAVGALAFYSVIAKSEERKRGGSATTPAKAALIDPNDPAAKAVNYVHDTKNVKDTKLQIERTGVKFKDQHCSGCAFYENDKETTVGGKKAGPCKMPFAAGKLVSSTGWCTSWAKK